MKKFRVTYWFVDNTYWDDGNRTTSRKKDFKSYNEAVFFAKEIISKGVWEKSWETNKSANFAVDKDNISIQEITTKIYPWWVVLDDFNYVVKKIHVCLKYDHFKELAKFQSEVVGFYDENYFKKALEKAKLKASEEKE